MGKLKDITGQTFGYWTVLERDQSTIGHVYWICKCKCGTVRSVLGNNLTQGKSKSCGCYHIEKVTKQETPGTKYGKLTILGPSRKNSDGDWEWLCKCECGNESWENGKRLRCGDTISCGCLRYVQERPGTRYGRLTIVGPSQHQDGRKCLKWLCKCDCGQKIWINGHSLRTGNTTSCGCSRDGQSKDALLIEKFLIDNKLKYSKEYKFDDCKDMFPLPFDFSVIINDKQYLIEYDGEQHDKYVPFFHRTEERFHTFQLHDQIKTNYCKEHNIPLLRIKFNQTKDIEKLLKEFLNI